MRLFKLLFISIALSVNRFTTDYDVHNNLNYISDEVVAYPSDDVSLNDGNRSVGSSPVYPINPRNPRNPINSDRYQNYKISGLSSGFVLVVYKGGHFLSDQNSKRFDQAKDQEIQLLKDQLKSSEEDLKNTTNILKEKEKELSSLSPENHEAMAYEADKLSKEIYVLRQEIQKETTKLDGIQSENKDSSTKLKNLQLDLQDLQTQRVLLEEEHKSIQLKTSKLPQEIEDLQKDLETKREQSKTEEGIKNMQKEKFASLTRDQDELNTKITETEALLLGQSTQLTEQSKQHDEAVKKEKTSIKDSIKEIKSQIKTSKGNLDLLNSEEVQLKSDNDYKKLLHETKKQKLESQIKASRANLVVRVEEFQQISQLNIETESSHQKSVQNLATRLQAFQTELGLLDGKLAEINQLKLKTESSNEKIQGSKNTLKKNFFDLEKQHQDLVNSEEEISFGITSLDANLKKRIEELNKKKENLFRIEEENHRLLKDNQNLQEEIDELNRKLEQKEGENNSDIRQPMDQEQLQNEDNQNLQEEIDELNRKLEQKEGENNTDISQPMDQEQLQNEIQSLVKELSEIEDVPKFINSANNLIQLDHKQQDDLWTNITIPLDKEIDKVSLIRNSLKNSIEEQKKEMDKYNKELGQKRFDINSRIKNLKYKIQDVSMPHFHFKGKEKFRSDLQAMIKERLDCNFQYQDLVMPVCDSLSTSTMDNLKEGLVQFKRDALYKQLSTSELNLDVNNFAMLWQIYKSGNLQQDEDYKEMQDQRSQMLEKKNRLEIDIQKLEPNNFSEDLLENHSVRMIMNKGLDFFDSCDNLYMNLRKERTDDFNAMFSEKLINRLTWKAKFKKETDDILTKPQYVCGRPDITKQIIDRQFQTVTKDIREIRNKDTKSMTEDEKNKQSEQVYPIFLEVERHIFLKKAAIENSLAPLNPTDLFFRYLENKKKIIQEKFKEVKAKNCENLRQFYNREVERIGEKPNEYLKKLLEKYDEVFNLCHKSLEIIFLCETRNEKEINQFINNNSQGYKKLTTPLEYINHLLEICVTSLDQFNNNDWFKIYEYDKNQSIIINSLIDCKESMAASLDKLGLPSLRGCFYDCLNWFQNKFYNFQVIKNRIQNLEQKEKKIRNDPNELEIWQKEISDARDELRDKESEYDPKINELSRFFWEYMIKQIQTRIKENLDNEEVQEVGDNEEINWREIVEKAIDGFIDKYKNQHTKDVYSYEQEIESYKQEIKQANEDFGEKEKIYLAKIKDFEIQMEENQEKLGSLKSFLETNISALEAKLKANLDNGIMPLEAKIGHTKIAIQNKNIEIEEDHNNQNLTSELISLQSELKQYQDEMETLREIRRTLEFPRDIYNKTYRYYFQNKNFTEKKNKFYFHFWDFNKRNDSQMKYQWEDSDNEPLNKIEKIIEARATIVSKLDQDIKLRNSEIEKNQKLIQQKEDEIQNSLSDLQDIEEEYKKFFEELRANKEAFVDFVLKETPSIDLFNKLNTHPPLRFVINNDNNDNKVFIYFYNKNDNNNNIVLFYFSNPKVYGLFSLKYNKNLEEIQDFLQEQEKLEYYPWGEINRDYKSNYFYFNYVYYVNSDGYQKVYYGEKYWDDSYDVKNAFYSYYKPDLQLVPNNDIGINELFLSRFSELTKSLETI